MVWTCLSVQEEFDTHDPKAHHFLKLHFLKKRSGIVEIVEIKHDNDYIELLETCIQKMHVNT
jgi:hypothetical protein